MGRSCFRAAKPRGHCEAMKTGSAQKLQCYGFEIERGECHQSPTLPRRSTPRCTSHIWEVVCLHRQISTSVKHSWKRGQPVSRLFFSEAISKEKAGGKLPKGRGNYPYPRCGKRKLTNAPEPGFGALQETITPLQSPSCSPCVKHLRRKQQCWLSVGAEVKVVSSWSFG